eukprot:TRINITY_DN22123_c0_g1_i1.p1 TRINITY_DN22123_c0_g1~~TRINITY_DN22123_c0_g1_i1.p1  ORF type:complete len:320 (-),score=56.46 TRINITY_DN22123_c0_g1_i1:116-1075(-)
MSPSNGESLSMARLLGVALRGGSSSAKVTQRESSKFAILPRQPREELVVSEVHTQLDRAIRWLLVEIGYTLLEDSRPCAGGSVRLPHRPPRPPRRAKSPVPVGNTDVEDVEEEYIREVVSFSTNTAEYAHYPDDLVIVWRFASILGDISPAALEKVKTEQLYKMTLQSIRLMHLCEYDYTDVVLTLAHASIYFRTVFEAVGERMSEQEVAHVCVLLIFLAHCFLLDRACPLRCWQSRIFKNYCTMKVLDAALFRLFDMRKFRLRITETEERKSLSILLRSTNEVDVVLRQREPRLDTGRFRLSRSEQKSSSSPAPRGGS